MLSPGISQLHITAVDVPIEDDPDSVLQCAFLVSTLLDSDGTISTRETLLTHEQVVAVLEIVYPE